MASAPRPEDYLVRRWAEENWPELAARGRATPIATGRSAQDYRDLVLRFIVAPDSVARPKVIIETDQRGPMEIELVLGPEAPMTVANFLRLVDRRFFDGNRWHRVVPNFVVQDGTLGETVRRPRRCDPRRGQSSPVRRPHAGHGALRSGYRVQPVVHQSTAAPPERHVYHLGRVTGGLASLARITQGDMIRTIRMK